MTRRRILVIGLGNPDRGDDGIGPAVAARLEGRLPSGVEILTRRGDLLSLVGDWAEAETVICIDAAIGASPGLIHRLDGAADALPRDVSLMSSHGFGLPEAIELAHALGSMPRRLIVYAVEGADFAGGAPISRAVAAAAGEVARRVAAEIESFLTLEAANA